MKGYKRQHQTPEGARRPRFSEALPGGGGHQCAGRGKSACLVTAERDRGGWGLSFRVNRKQAHCSSGERGGCSGHLTLRPGNPIRGAESLSQLAVQSGKQSAQGADSKFKSPSELNKPMDVDTILIMLSDFYLDAHDHCGCEVSLKCCHQ